MLTIEVDPRPITEGFSRLVQRQVPYATALALNETAKVVQRTEQEAQDRRFTIAPARRAFMRRLVKIPRGSWATKQRPEVTVRILGPENDEGRGALLDRHEDGGTQVARDPLRPFFIPADVLRPGEYDLPPRKLYPSALGLAPYRLISGGETVRGARTTKRGTVQLRGKLRTFVIPVGNTQNTGAGIYQREGKEEIQRLWLLSPRVRLKARLRFRASATETAAEELPRQFVAALAKATRA